MGRGGWVRLPRNCAPRPGSRRACAHAWRGGRSCSARPGDGASVDAEPVDLRERRPGRVVAELRGVEKAFGERQVFARLDAEFRSGLLTVVTGRSGSEQVDASPPAGGARTGCGRGDGHLGSKLAELDRQEGRGSAARTWASSSRIPVSSVPDRAENVELGLALRGVPSESARTEAAQALSVVGMADRSEHHVARLSAGERARVAVARAIAPRRFCSRTRRPRVSTRRTPLRSPACSCAWPTSSRRRWCAPPTIRSSSSRPTRRSHSDVATSRGAAQSKRSRGVQLRQREREHWTAVGPSSRRPGQR